MTNKPTYRAGNLNFGEYRFEYLNEKVSFFDSQAFLLMI